jgi:hypothetical protein
VREHGAARKALSARRQSYYPLPSRCNIRTELKLLTICQRNGEIGRAKEHVAPARQAN